MKKICDMDEKITAEAKKLSAIKNNIKKSKKPSPKHHRLGNLEIHPTDLPTTLTYLEAEKAVAALGDGWRIPTLEDLKLMYKHRDEISGFKTASSSGSDSPDWYWSSTEHRDHPSYVWLVRFSDGYVDWNRKDDFRLCCRPVRLVAAPAS